MCFLVYLLFWFNKFAFDNASLTTSIDHIDNHMVFVNLEIKNHSETRKIRLPGFRIGWRAEIDSELVASRWFFVMYKDGQRVDDLRHYFNKLYPIPDFIIGPEEVKICIFSVDLEQSYLVYYGDYKRIDNISGDYSLQVCCSVSNKYTIISNAIEFSIP